MTKKYSSLAMVLGTISLFSTAPASAMILDFIGHIDNVSGERAIEATPSLNPFSSVYVPIATTALGYSGSASDGITGDLPYAYFDRNQAGIGVCKVLTAGNQCNPTNDDNVTTGEILGLKWGTSVILHSLSFRGEAHPSDPSFLATDKFDYSVNGGVNWMTMQLINAKDGVVSFGDLLLGANQEILLAFNNEQFYVSAASLTAVPLPAAAWLLGSGLVGLFAVGRRRRAGTFAS